MSSARPLQTYEGGEVVVTFDPRLCIHSENCVRGLPAVFDPTRKRWIRPDEASADQVLAAVASCPSGALRARRRGTDASPAAPEPRPELLITVTANGPLLLRGTVRIQRESGEVIAEGDAVALCRCGGTSNPPFCDGTHTRIGFSNP